MQRELRHEVRAVHAVQPRERRANYRWCRGHEGMSVRDELVTRYWWCRGHEGMSVGDELITGGVGGTKVCQ